MERMFPSHMIPGFKPEVNENKVLGAVDHDGKFDLPRITEFEMLKYHENIHITGTQEDRRLTVITHDYGNAGANEEVVAKYIPEGIYATGTDFANKLTELFFDETGVKFTWNKDASKMKFESTFNNIAGLETQKRQAYFFRSEAIFLNYLKFNEFESS